MAVKAEGSGAWLLALLASSYELHLGGEELRIAVGLLLGALLVRGPKPSAVRVNRWTSQPRWL